MHLIPQYFYAEMSGRDLARRENTCVYSHLLNNRASCGRVQGEPVLHSRPKGGGFRNRDALHTAPTEKADLEAQKEPMAATLVLTLSVEVCRGKAAKCHFQGDFLK